MKETSESLLVFGGSFDPPHVGHVLAVHYALLTSPVGQALVVPCAEHPFGKDHSPFRHRLAMTRLAFTGLGDRVQVLDVEANRPGPSYTVDTIREIAGQYPDARLELLVGSDILREIDQWKDSEDLLRLVKLRVLPRLEENAGEDPENQETPFYLPRISSTTVRQMVREGRDIAPHVPSAVVEYIQQNALYRESSSRV